MKRIYLLILGILALNVVLFKLGKPLESMSVTLFADEVQKELFDDTIIRLVVFGVFLVIARKLGLTRFNGIGRDVVIKNKSVLLVPILFVAAGLKGNWQIYADAETVVLILFMLSVISTGLAEEVTMRGMVLPLLIYSRRVTKNSLYFGVIVSSMIFGLLHFFNLTSQPENYGGITRQVIFATSLGIVFGALMLRTGNLFILAVFHGCINFLLGHSVLGERTVEELPEDIHIAENPDWVSWAGIIGIFFILLLIGLNMIRKVDKEAVESDLEQVTV